MPTVSTLMPSDEIRSFLKGPVAINFVSTDALHTPDIERVCGAALIGDRTMRILIGAHAATARANAQVGAVVGVLVTDMTTLHSIQWKGTVTAAASMRSPGDMAVMHDHVAAFRAGAEALGMAQGVTLHVYTTDVVALEMRLEEEFDQTPGVGAGRKRIR